MSINAKTQVSDSFKQLTDKYSPNAVYTVIGIVIGVIAHALVGLNGILILTGIYFIFKYFNIKQKPTDKGS